MKQIFKLRSQGLSHQAISDYLGQRGFISPKTGRPYKHSIISRILSNKFYIGIMTIGDRQYPHKHPKLVSKDLFGQCQTMKQKRLPKRVAYNSKKFIFKGLMSCDLCNRTISTYMVKSNNYLKCANGFCKNPNTAESMALASIDKALASLSMPPQTIEQVQKRLKARQAGQAAKTAQSKRKLAELDSKADILYSDRLLGRINAEFYDRQAKKLEKERQKLKTQKNFLTFAPKGLKKTVYQMINLCRNAQKLFQKAEISTKNLMLEILLSNLRLKNKELSFALNFPSGRAGKIQFSGQESQIDNFGDPTGNRTPISRLRTWRPNL